MGEIEEFSGSALIPATVGGRHVEYLARDLAGIGEIKTYGGTSYVLKRADSGCLTMTTAGSGVSIVVPPSSQTLFPFPTRISFAQFGTGQLTFVAGDGVTIHSPETLKLAKQYAAGTLIALSTDVWLLAGYLATS